MPMPDAEHYEEWKGRPPPARDKFHMPSSESYAAWADPLGAGHKASEREDESEDYGPKTAAMPEEGISSAQFRGASC